ncbi:MAG: hypothetical protein NTV51_06855 [Verrucomicrobia bacterium]|nr:hypothetical protein [Verrucomicrobiota bacterium]
MVVVVNWIDIVHRWRQLPEAARLDVRWQRVPRQVALSMAFEKEPVDESWLKARHLQATPPVLSKRRAAS